MWTMMETKNNLEIQVKESQIDKESLLNLFVKYYVEKRPIGKIKCPRCGNYGYLSIEPRGNPSNYYIYIKHKDVGKQYKCYLGAVKYIYVNKFNEEKLRSALTAERHIDYAVEALKNVINVLREGKDLGGFIYDSVNVMHIRRKLNELKQLVQELESLLNQ